MDATDTGSRILLAERTPWSRKRRQKKLLPSQKNYSAIDMPSHATGNSSRKPRSISLHQHEDFQRETDLLYQYSNTHAANANRRVSIPLTEHLRQGMQDLIAGVIAFLLSATIAVSCASVVVGHGTELSGYISHIIDMNFLGTALLCLFLAYQSTAPYVVGAIDVFVAPIMGEMAFAISSHLHHDMAKVLPTVIAMIAVTGTLLGLLFYLLGAWRITSLANYIPFPVIAGFLSGVGATLIRNGLHMTGGSYFPYKILTLGGMAHILPAVMFALCSRWMRSRRIPVAISFPLLLITSVVGCHLVAYVTNTSMKDLRTEKWVFSWSPKLMRTSALWYSWTHIDFNNIHWHAFLVESYGYLLTLLFLGALKYSVFASALSTVFGRDISADKEMKIIGVANILTGLAGCTGGCHYLSAMGMLQSIGSREKVPAVICALLYLVVWTQGFAILGYVPKFVFGGLLLNVGSHFLEGYLIVPCKVISHLEIFTVFIIMIGFVSYGMLQSVALGILISVFILTYRIQSVGCIRYESTGALSRSSVDRNAEEAAFLDIHGNQIHILRLQGFVFFGTSVSILERVESRLHCPTQLELACLVVDFSLVPDFDATALNNFRKLNGLAERHQFHLWFTGMSVKVQQALHHNPSSPFLHYADDIDLALEECEQKILPSNLAYVPITDHYESVMELWEHFLFQQIPNRLLPIVVHLTIVELDKNEILSDRKDTYFVCLGYIEVRSDIRIRKAGPGSVITRDECKCSFTAGSDTLLLRLSESSMDTLSKSSPQLALEMLRFINLKLSSRCNQSDKRISQLSYMTFR